jgi:superfamily I DNA/RNA helicase
MTVHAAKGLEFGVVAVADLGRSLPARLGPCGSPQADGPDGGEATRVGVQLGRLGRPGERYTTTRVTELAAERQRRRAAAYVAATRAKRRPVERDFQPGQPAEPSSETAHTSWSPCSVATSERGGGRG